MESVLNVATILTAFAAGLSAPSFFELLKEWRTRETGGAKTAKVSIKMPD